MFLIVGGGIFLMDAAIIAGLPLALVAAKRRGLAFLCSIIIGALIIVDRTINFANLSYPKAYPFRLIGLPAEVFPLSLFLIISSIAFCGWMLSRRI